MKPTKGMVLAFFLLTFALSWAIWIPVMTGSFGLPGFLFPAAGLVGALMPGIAALLVAAYGSGRSGVLTLLRQVTVWRLNVRWYALALLLMPLVIGIVYAASSLARGTPLPAPPFTFGALLFMMLIQIPNTLMEEIGWRGFALPHMAERNGWLRASLALGIIWATWHLPYWISGSNVHRYGPLSVALFFVMPIAASVILAWMYRNTRSVLLAWLFHLSTNTAIAFLPLSSEEIGSLWPQALYAVVVALLGLAAAVLLERPVRIGFRNKPVHVARG